MSRSELSAAFRLDRPIQVGMSDPNTAHVRMDGACMDLKRLGDIAVGDRVLRQAEQPEDDSCLAARQFRTHAKPEQIEL